MALFCANRAACLLFLSLNPYLRIYLSGFESVLAFWTLERCSSAVYVSCLRSYNISDPSKCFGKLYRIPQDISGTLRPPTTGI